MDNETSRMANSVKIMVKEKQLCFDDILLVPQYSTVNSRKEIDLRMFFGVSVLPLPVIASPMDTVCELDMAIAMAKNGGIGFIHRFMPIEKQVAMIRQAAEKGYFVGASVGAKNGYLDDANKLIDAGATAILVDTANGHSEYAIQAVSMIRDSHSDIHIMAGNVATSSGFIALSQAGADSVRVGIGGGSVCTTRIVSGHGVPTLASVIMCKEIKNRMNLNTAIVADGGIRNTGDMIKAFAAGADAVMLGSMLAGTDESPGEIIETESGKFKTFRGMASKEANDGKDIAIAEGVTTMVKYKGSVEKIIADIRGGLGSGCSYSGVDKLVDLYESALYVEVSPLSNKESQPHGKK